MLWVAQASMNRCRCCITQAPWFVDGTWGGPVVGSLYWHWGMGVSKCLVDTDTLWLETSTYVSRSSWLTGLVSRNGSRQMSSGNRHITTFTHIHRRLRFWRHSSMRWILIAILGISIFWRVPMVIAILWSSNTTFIILTLRKANKIIVAWRAITSVITSSMILGWTI